MTLFLPYCLGGDLSGSLSGHCSVASMRHIQFGCKNAFLTQLEVPYYKCQFKIVAKTSNGLELSKHLELDCSASLDH